MRPLRRLLNPRNARWVRLRRSRTCESDPRRSSTNRIDFRSITDLTALKESSVSHFGDLVRKFRKEKGLTLEDVAEKIGSHKGYVSGIENDKVNPPSVKIIKKCARLFSQDERTLVRIAWADKAPAIIREDAQRVLALAETEGTSPVDLSRFPLINTL